MKPRIEIRAHILAFAVISALVLFWPLLGQPLILDDVDIFAIMSGDNHAPVSAVFMNLLGRLTLPHHFRPLAAPIYLAFNTIFGPTPFPLRVAIVLFNLGAAIGIFHVAKSLSGREGVGFFASAFYALSWIHWDCVAVAANMPQAVAHALFWQSLWMFVREDGDWGMIKAVRSFIPVTVALLFKEDVIVFPVFVLAVSLFVPHLRLRLERLCLVFGIWVIAYCSLRLVLPNSFTSTESYLKFNLAGMLNVKSYTRGYSLLLDSWVGILPPTESLSRFVEVWRADSGLTVWVAAVLVLGACLGRFAWEYSLARTDEGLNQGKIAAIALLSLAGSVASIMTYAVFDAVHSWNSHRFLIAWGALSVGLGSVVYPLCRLLALRRRWIQSIFIGFGACLLLKTAIVYRFPDANIAAFSRLYLLYETRQRIPRIHEAITSRSTLGDELVFEGFDPMLRVPQHLQLLEKKLLNVRVSGTGPAPYPIRGLSIRSQTAPGQVSLTITRFQVRHKCNMFAENPISYE